MIELGFPPASLSGHANGNNRWAKIKVTKEWREKARAATEAVRYVIPEEGDIRIHITFVPPNRRGDRVNFPSRIKPIIDGVADALGVNDSRFLPQYHFCAPEKPGRIEIRIGS